jgi:tight adherence protein B
MPQWVFIAAFGFLFLVVLVALYLGLGWTTKQHKRKVEELLKHTGGRSAPMEESTILSDAGPGGPSALSRLPFYAEIQRNIRLAALEWTPEAVLGAMLVLAIIGALLGTRVSSPVLREATMAGVAAIGAFIPYFVVRMKARKRMEAFEELFPEALDFLSRSMRAGHAFSVSLEMMAEETPDPVGAEFRWIFHEQNLGSPLETTLRNFAQRIPLLDTKLFVSAILLQRETGGNLAEILTKLSYIIRERFRLKGQVRAASAHGRITSVILSLMPLVTLILLNLIAPEYFQYMVDDEHGRWIILAVLVLQGVGYYWMRKIIDIKV